MSLKNLLRKEKVKEVTGLSNSTLYLYIQKNKFPAPIKIGERASAWIEEEVNDWIESRIAESRKSS